MGMGAPLYLPTPGTPEWLDPRLFAQDEDEWLTLDYRMRTEPLEVVALIPRLEEVPPVLAPYVRVVGWIVEHAPDPPLPSVPILQVEHLPSLLPPDAMVIVDANAGVAYIDPNVATLTRYQSQLLRVATHVRYRIESAHLPVRTWDNQRIEVGGALSHWNQIRFAVEQGAEILLSEAPAPPDPNEVPLLAHQLGGKSLWWVIPRALLDEPALQESLWRWGAEMTLTLLPNPPEGLESWWQQMQRVKSELRLQHIPLGTLQLGWLGVPPDTATEQVRVSLWNSVESIDDFWQARQQALALGLYRAVQLPDAEPHRLAVALASTPHAIFVPSETVPLAKQRIALLGTSECRTWLLKRLAEGDSEALLAQPAEWIAMRQ